MLTRSPIPYRTPGHALRLVPSANPLSSCYLAGESVAIRRVRSQLERLAPYFRLALVTGEPGTGKETVARTLHARSGGADGPFVVCQAITLAEQLARSGTQDKNLRARELYEAHRGTLLLENVNSLPLALQGTLLRLLQHLERQRSQRCDPELDLRIVATSDRELRTLSVMGQFREELRRHISAVEITLPPLRKRHEDMAAIAAKILQNLLPGELCHGLLSGAALLQLQHQSWPENIRELRQILQSSLQAAAGDVIEPRHLPLPHPQPETASPADERRMARLQEVVHRHVLDVLTQCSGNKLRASEILGISRSTLYRMLEAGATDRDASYPG